MYEFLNYRKITIADAQLLMDWRSAPHVAQYMLTQIERNLEKQREWIERCSKRLDYHHRIIRIENKDVGYCSITIKDAEAQIGELGVYIGDLNTLRQLSIYNFLGTMNHAFFTLGLNKIINQVSENNPRTIRLQTLNGYEYVGFKPINIDGNNDSSKMHFFEISKDRWYEFRKKFRYFLDWDGNFTEGKK
jgi:RimJ/RimL family protein N-acetyltransferase